MRSRDGFRAWYVVDGRRIFGTVRDTSHEAYQDALRMRELGASAPVRALTIQEACEIVLARASTECRQGTVDWYRDQFAAVLAVIRPETPLLEVDAAVLRLFIARRSADKVSASTILAHKRALHRLFVLCMRGGHVDRNPVLLVEWPQADSPRMDFLELTELRAMLDRIRAESPEDADLVSLVLYTGLRRSELARLQVGDVDCRTWTIWVQGKRRREPILVAPELQPILASMVARRGGEGPLVPPLAPARQGASARRNRSADAVSAVFRRWAKKLGDRRFHAHALRHSLATGLLRAGERPEVVQAFLRHRTFAMTLRYTHVTSPELRAAASRLRLLSSESESSAL